MSTGAHGEAAQVSAAYGSAAATMERARPLSARRGRALLAALVLLTADWLTVCACLAVVWWLRAVAAEAVFPGLGPVQGLRDTFADVYALVPWTIAFAGARFYTHRALFWDEVRRALYACTVATLWALALSFAARRAGNLSRLIIAGLWGTAVVAVPLVRYHCKRLLAAAGLWHNRVLIIGGGESGVQVCERVVANPDLGYAPVAFVDDDEQKIGSQLAGLPVLGPLAATPQLIRALDVRHVIMALPGMAREPMLHLVSSCEGHVESIRLVPDLIGFASAGVEAEDLDGVLLLHMRWNLARPWNLLVKRSFDLVVATAAALLLAPLWLAAALAIRIDSPGPIFFVQERLGRDRRPFRCIKFRTMFVDGDERLRRHLAAHPESRTEWERYAKLRSFDPRLTRPGRVLRRLSLDELPQLINVFHGDMSLVGPRPYLPAETQRMGDFAETVLKASPGITGLWQVSGRNQLPFTQRLRLDEHYVRNWSLWLDAVVLVQTLGAVLRRRGAY